MINDSNKNIGFLWSMFLQMEHKQLSFYSNFISESVDSSVHSDLSWPPAFITNIENVILKGGLVFKK